MEFAKWFNEVGTGTNSVAAFKRPVFSTPVTRKFLGPWAEEDPFFKKLKDHQRRFADWLHGRQRLDELAPTQANMGFTQTLPQGNQPVVTTPGPQQQPLATVSVNPSNYKGNNKPAYTKVYNDFLRTKNPKLGAALYNAIQGNDQELASTAKAPVVNNNPNMVPTAVSKNI